MLIEQFDMWALHHEIKDMAIGQGRDGKNWVIQFHTPDGREVTATALTLGWAIQTAIAEACPACRERGTVASHDEESSHVRH